MRAPALLAFLVLSTCGVEPGAAPEAAAPAERPDAPRFECAVGGPARSFEGHAPALAENAVVVHDARERATLHRLDLPSEPPLTLPVRVLAIMRHGAGWLAATPGQLVELDDEGHVDLEIPLTVEATEAALAIEGRTVTLAMRDAEDEVSLAEVSLATREVGPVRGIGRGRGRLLVAPGHVSFRGAPPGPEEAGAPIAFAGADILFEARDRTGIWGGDPPVRMTHPWTSARAPLATRLGERVVLAYTADADLFVQAADLTEGALGQPVLVAPDAVASELVAVGERFWLAWERGPDAVEVRAGECASNDD